MKLNILGISAYYHNSACCLLENGKLVSAAEEERFTRIKHDSSLPIQSVKFCLEQGNLNLTDVDCIAYYENPTKKLSRQIWMNMITEPSDFSRKQLGSMLQNIGRVQREIRQLLGYEGPIDFVDHHEAHAASSFYFSGFLDAAILTVDGVGEWATTTYGKGEGSNMKLFEEVHFPDSIGLLYSTITSYLGFEVNDGEYKVMGLAPYGKPLYVDKVHALLELKDEGQYKLNMEYFDFLEADRMYSQRLEELFGQPARKAESELLGFHKDVARSLQVALEEILLNKVRYLHKRVNSENLCMAGGVALNCVANNRVLRDGPFSRLSVQPASYDAGGALGAAAIAHVRMSKAHPNTEEQKEVFLGPSYTSDEIAGLFQATSAKVLDFRGKTSLLIEATVERLAKGKVVGWFSGRMEFGPRALGARSIIADPRGSEMRDKINALVKKREGFRPFAPAVLAEKAKEHFELDHPSPFMLETCQVNSKLDLPAITHVDGSARVQTVHKDTNPRFAMLLEHFDERTGCPILLNTSFNMRGEAIVCSPTDAIISFVRSSLDTLVLEDFILDKESIPPLWVEFINKMPIPGQKISKNVYTFL